MKFSTVSRLTMPILVMAVVSACAASGIDPEGSGELDPGAQTSAPAATRPPFTTIPPLGSDPAIDVPADVDEATWTAVLEALESKLGAIDASAVDLMSVEPMTWSDGSLGCPKAGQAYTQALVDGFQVVVEMNGEEYDFRVPLDGEPRLCEPRAPGGGG